MERFENKETGHVEFRFTGGEFMKVKRILAALAACFCVGAGLTCYSVWSMSSLRAENELYRNQLRMAEEKMESLDQKIDNVEKISREVESMVTGNVGNAKNGVGGASTVPDKAKNIAVKTVKDPGDLLARLVRMDEKLTEEMRRIISLRSDLLTRSFSAQMIHQAFETLTPNMWPVYGEVSSGFGWRESPENIGSSYHEGIDIATDYNVPVKVTADGVVTRTGWEDGYGYLVEVRHANGIVTRYGHNSAIVTTEGQQVRAGDTVALAGSTGNSTGPHTHYEVRVNGTAVDPMLFLK